MQVHKWEKYLPVLKSNNSYVYKLVDYNGEVAYVGQTKDLESRVSFHLKNKPDIKYVEYIEVPSEQADSWESEYIIRYLPRYNKSIPRGERFMSLVKFSKYDQRFSSNEVLAIRLAKNFDSVGGYYHIDDLKQISVMMDMEVKRGYRP